MPYLRGIMVSVQCNHAYLVSFSLRLQFVLGPLDLDVEGADLLLLLREILCQLITARLL